MADRYRGHKAAPHVKEQLQTLHGVPGDVVMGGAAETVKVSYEALPTTCEPANHLIGTRRPRPEEAMQMSYRAPRLVQQALRGASAASEQRIASR